MATFKSKVLNLWNDAENQKFRIVPEVDAVRFLYENGSIPVEVPYLTSQGENVYSKMTANAQAVVDEKARAVGAESALSNSITQETNRALSAEDALLVSFNDEKARVATQEAFEASERALERSERISADNAFTAQLNAEIQSRQANDVQHTNDINAENLRAENRENEIEASLDAYKLSNDSKIGLIDDAHNNYVENNDIRSSNIELTATNNYNALYNMITTNNSSNTDEVKRLDGRIDFITNNVDASALDSLSELLNKFTNDGLSYEQRLSNIESVLQELVAQLGS